MNREGWFPSSTLIDILEKIVVNSKGVFDEYKPTQSTDEAAQIAGKDVYIHVIYGSIIAALAVTLCIVRSFFQRMVPWRWHLKMLTSTST